MPQRALSLVLVWQGRQVQGRAGTMQVLESHVEYLFAQGLAELGVDSIKLRLLGSSGWPDRLVLIPGGIPIFIELKRPGGKLRKLQRHRHKTLRGLGYEVKTYSDPLRAVRYIKRKMAPKAVSKEGC